MPKRTNQFQELVAQIQQLLAAKGAKVSTSVMLKYFGIDAEREVDILIEGEWGAKTIRLAVEANAEARPMTVEGINQYIDSYRGRCGLPVTDFIIVTKNGYTSTARDVAAANNIELLTLSEAKDYEWSKFLPGKPQHMTFNRPPHPCQLRSEPNNVPSKLLMSSKFVCKQCGAKQSVRQFAWNCLHEAMKVAENVRKFKEALALRPEVRGWFPVPINPKLMVEVEGRQVEIKTLHVMIHIARKQAPVKCTVFQQVSTQGPTRSIGRLAADFGDHEMSIMIPEWKDGKPPEKLLVSFKSNGATATAPKRPRKKTEPKVSRRRKPKRKPR